MRVRVRIRSRVRVGVRVRVRVRVRDRVIPPRHAGRLGCVGDAAPTEQHVDQGRLAHVGAADEGRLEQIALRERVHGDAARDEAHLVHERVRERLVRVRGRGRGRVSVRVRVRGSSRAWVRVRVRVRVRLGLG